MSIPGFINLGIELCYLYNQITIYIYCRDITCNLQDVNIYNKSFQNNTPLHTQQSPINKKKQSNIGTEIFQQEYQEQQIAQDAKNKSEEQSEEIIVYEDSNEKQIEDYYTYISRDSNRNNLQIEDIKKDNLQKNNSTPQGFDQNNSNIHQSEIDQKIEALMKKYKRGINTFQNVLLLYSLVAFIESIEARICVVNVNANVSFPSIIPLFLLNIIISFSIYMIFGYFLIFLVQKTEYIRNNRLYILKFFLTLYLINMPFLLYDKIEERVQYDSISILLSYSAILLGLYMSNRKKNIKFINDNYLLKIWE